MTVVRMWGRVDGKDSLPFHRNGDDFYFDVPDGYIGDLLCEFWAQDEAGNIGYRAAILTISLGGRKCIRWLDTGGECIMHPIRRPESEFAGIRPVCIMHPKVCSEMAEVLRPACDMLPIVCPRAEA